MRKLLALGLLGAAARALANRRRLPPERVDVYLKDGTLQAFAAGSEDADAILPLAREILSATG